MNNKRALLVLRAQYQHADGMFFLHFLSKSALKSVGARCCRRNLKHEKPNRIGQ